MVPKRRSEAGSGVGLMGPEELASPNAETESCKEWNPGVSPSKKISEPESKLLQLLEQLLKFESRVLLSRITEKLASENENSLWPVEGIKDELRFRLKETVNGKVTVVAFSTNQGRLPRCAGTRVREGGTRPAGEACYKCRCAVLRQ